MLNFILKRDPVWLESLPPVESRTTIILLSGDGEEVAVPVPLLPAVSPLVQSILADTPLLAFSPCFISLPSTVGAVLLAVRDILTTGTAAAGNWEELEQVKQVLRMLGVGAKLFSCQLAEMGGGFGVGEIVGNYSEGPDVDLLDGTDELDITIKLEEKEITCSSKGMGNANESKIVLRECSVQEKRCQPAAFSLTQEEKDNMQDQLLYQDDTVKYAFPGGGKGAPEDGGTDDVGLHEGNSNMNFQCPKCGKGFRFGRLNYIASLRRHILSHYHKEFYKVLPDCKPYPCPICGKCKRDRVTLAQHYAFKHKKVFEMTDLTPADLQGIPEGGRAALKDTGAVLKCSKCLLGFDDIGSARTHVLSHYHQVFFNVLPDRKPFPCPICAKVHRDRITLIRHYALAHKKVFEMTDLTREDLHYPETNVTKE